MTAIMVTSHSNDKNGDYHVVIIVMGNTTSDLPINMGLTTNFNGF